MTKQILRKIIKPIEISSGNLSINKFFGQVDLIGIMVFLPSAAADYLLVFIIDCIPIVSLGSKLIQHAQQFAGREKWGPKSANLGSAP